MVLSRTIAMIGGFGVIEETANPSEVAGKLDVPVDQLGVRVGVEHHRGPSPEHLVAVLDEEFDLVVKLTTASPARAAPRPEHSPRPSDLLLDAYAALITDGRDTAAPMLRQAVGAFAGAEVTAEEGLRWGWLFPVAAAVVWEDATWHAIAVR
jgi:hypothetical protein